MACVDPVGGDADAAGGDEFETRARSSGVIFRITQQAFGSESPVTGEWAVTEILCLPGSKFGIGTLWEIG